MGALWEYFEELDELVYVVDMESYRLVYVNRYGREHFALRDSGGDSEKKCYAVLYNRSSPCPSCDNQALTEGQYRQWTYWNPRMDQCFLFNSTVVVWNGRRCRMSVAVRTQEKTPGGDDLSQCEALICECLLQTYTTNDPDQALQIMLKGLREKFGCARLELYELQRDEHCIRRTYGWEGSAQPPLRVRLPQDFDTRYEPLRSCGTQILEKWQEATERYPEVCQGAGTVPVLLIPLLHQGELRGILRMDRPEKGTSASLAALGGMVSYFMTAALNRWDMLRNLARLGYRDQLTGARNRHAMYADHADTEWDQPVGMVYGDIVGLKNVNDLLGHQRGDDLIVRTYQTMVTVFSEKQVYRIGGDEFLVICLGMGRSEFAVRLEILQRELMAQNCNVSLGSVWAGKGRKDFEKLLKCADRRMYRAKQRFYDAAGEKSAPRDPAGAPEEDRAARAERDPFAAFLQTCRFDMETFLQSITMEGATVYLYWGDMQKQLFCISDNLKRDFNFPANLIPDFVALLDKRIVPTGGRTPAEDLQEILEQKKTVCSSTYQIYDRSGMPVWMHCQGTLKWSEDKTQPLFFSGLMVPLVQEAKIDPVTGLVDASHVLDAVLRREEGKELLILVVALREFQEITQILGLETGIAIMQEMDCGLRRELGETFRLIRMDGMHFMMVSSISALDAAASAQAIQQYVREIYRRHGAYMETPCSIGVLRTPRDGSTAREVLENAWALLQRAQTARADSYLEFTPELLAACKRELCLSSALSDCVNRGFAGFRIVIQPQVRTGSGEIIGGEALLRWNYQGEEIPPSTFIPILERMDLMVPVGKWVITQVMQACRRLLRLDKDFLLSFNVSYPQIKDDTLYDFIRKTMEEYGVPGRNLLIELTESHFDEMPEKLGTFVEQCRGLGIGFALDDYGTAYSSLQMLLRYPADLIKLDQSLTEEIASSMDKLDFIMSIIYACHRFGRKCV